MAQSIQTITDKSLFKGIFDKKFSSSDVFIKTKSGNLKVQYLGYSNDNVAFRIPHVKNIPEMIIVFVRVRDETVYGSVKYLERNEDTFIFLPVKFQIIVEARQSERKELGGTKNSTSVVYVKNIVSDYAITNELSMSDKKVGQIKEIVTFDLRKQFSRIRVFFINESKSDIRMKYVNESQTPIFIPDYQNEPAQKSKAYNKYINEIYSKDIKLQNQKDLVSEITVPFLFRALIPYGYVQVNHTAFLTDGQYAVIKRTGVIVNELFRKYKMFEPEQDRFLVSDISKGGLGIVFKDRRQTRFFRQDCYVSCDIILPSKSKSSIGAIVKNITFLESGIIKVGLQIHNIDAISEVHFDEFLESIGQPTE